MPSSVPKSDFPQSERFRFQGELGRGGMGIVYRAVDTDRDAVVAVKTLQNLDGSEIYRLKREFRTLSDLIHPNLVRLHELHAEGENWFFSMEYISGCAFLEYIRFGSTTARIYSSSDSSRSFDSIDFASQRWRAELDREFERTSSFNATTDGSPEQTDIEDEELREAPSGKLPSTVQLMRLRSALRQLAEGLRVLHLAGKLHRDIKPSNVMVTREGRVVLLDFGLALEWTQAKADQSLADRVVGTPAYMSPEQAASGTLTPASDWYAVGVILYEALLGHRPFHGPALKLMLDKQHQDPPWPKDFVRHLPKDLVELCQELLQRNPDRRPKGDEVVRRLGVEVDDPSQSLSSSSLSSTPFVGREKELADFASHLDRVATGHTVVLNMEGNSGLGKSALLERFLAEAADRPDAVILTGKCYEREAVPYKAIDSLVDSLSHFLVHLPRNEAEALIPRDIAAVAKLFPVLRRVKAVAEAPRRRADTPDQQELRGRAFHALRELLARLGDRRLLVLAIDDLQWGDLDSIALLGEILRGPDPPVMLLLASSRREDSESSVVLKTFRQLQADHDEAIDSRNLSIDPLTVDAATDLASRLLGENTSANEALCHEIAMESAGNPYFVDALVRQIQLGEAVNLANSQSRLNLDEVLWSRAMQLPDAARRLLGVVSAAGQPISHLDAIEAAELEEDASQAIDLLRISRLIRSSGSATMTDLETYHDRVRETVLAHLPIADIQDLHARLARTLEASGNCDAATLANHYMGADQLERAGEYFVIAAGNATDTLAFDRAAALYRLALNSLPKSHKAQRHLRRCLADTLANAGRGHEAAEQYMAAIDGADAADALELQRRAAGQSLISGHIDDGLVALREVLERVGMTLPGSPLKSLTSMMWRRLLLRLRGLQFKRRDLSQISAEEVARCDICWAASTGLSVVDTIRGADFQARCLMLSLNLGEPYRISRALTLEALHRAVAGQKVRDRVEELLKQSDALADEANSPHAKALVQGMSGLAAFLQGRWRAAIELCDEAQTRLRNECTGVAWEINTVQSFGLWAMFYAGDVKPLSERLPVYRAEAVERGNLYALNNLGTFATPLSLLAADAPDQAEEDLNHLMGRWSNEGFHVQHLNGQFGRAQIEIYRGRGAAARDGLLGVWPQIKRSQLLRVHQCSIIFTQLKARCWLASISDGESAEVALPKVEKCIQWLLRSNTGWAIAIARPVQAAVEFQRGNNDRAIEMLRLACDELEEVDMMLFANSARLRLGELTGGSEGKSEIESARQWMESQSIQNHENITELHAPGLRKT